MGRAIIVLGSTLLFGLTGLLIGWLIVQVETSSKPLYMHSNEIIFCYGIAPLAGAAIGFVLSVLVTKLFVVASKGR